MTEQNPKPVITEELSDNAIASLSYLLLIPAFFVLFNEKYKENVFVKTHAVQAISLFVVWIFFTQASAVLFAISALLMPFALGHILSSVWLALHSFFSWVFVFGWIALAVLSYKGKTYSVPFLTALREKALRFINEKVK